MIAKTWLEKFRRNEIYIYTSRKTYTQTEKKQQQQLTSKTWLAQVSKRVVRDLTNDHDHNVMQFKWSISLNWPIISHFDNICMWFFKLFSCYNYHCVRRHEHDDYQFNWHDHNTYIYKQSILYVHAHEYTCGMQQYIQSETKSRLNAAQLNYCNH